MTRMSPEDAAKERPITTPGQLVVEGRVSEMFFRELIRNCRLEDKLEVRTFGGISDLGARLRLLREKPVFKEKVQRLGIVRDAEDAEAVDAFRSVQSTLRGASLPVPVDLKSLSPPPLQVGVFILPDCEGRGMLEDLCLSAIQGAELGMSNPVLPCVDSFFECLNRVGKQPKNMKKARFAGYALACDVIDPALGRAAQQNAIPWEAKVFEPLKEFLHLIAGNN